MLPFTNTETHVCISVCTSVSAYPRVTNAILSTKYFDDETELAYYGYRYYSPGLGRFIRRDPIGEIGAMLTALNTLSDILLRASSELAFSGSSGYAFVQNSPIGRLDLFGLTDGYIIDPAVCETAEDNGWDEDAGGAFVCYQGQTYMCIWQEFEEDSPAGIKECYVLHEQTHWDNGDVADCEDCEDGRAPFPDDYGEQAEDDAECKAYVASFQCLREKMATECGALSGAAKTACESAYCVHITSHSSNMINKCAPGVPPGRTGWTQINSPCGLMLIPVF